VIQYNSGTNTTTIVDHLIYSSFGKITSQTNSAYQPTFAYTGQMWDAAAGLYYYHARWYDASTGRFISRDPLSFAAGDPNLYRYVKNGPTNFTDPTGLAQQGPPSSDGITVTVNGPWSQAGKDYYNSLMDYMHATHGQPLPDDGFGPSWGMTCGSW